MAADIRPAAHQDLDALCRIERECFAEDAFTRRQLAYLLAQAQGTLLAAEENGEITGYISLLLRKRTCSVRIYSVAVAPAHRGKGIARRLMEQAVAFTTAHGRTALTLEVRCDNIPAITLYERFGFRRIGRLPKYYHEGGDGWRMMLSK